MSLRSRAATWWRAVAERDALDRQVKEELEFHLESYAEDLMRSGVSREQAMRRARAELGSVAVGREKCRAAGSGSGGGRRAGVGPGGSEPALWVEAVGFGNLRRLGDDVGPGGAGG